jgi:hypothetical protein
MKELWVLEKYIKSIYTANIKTLVLYNDVCHERVKVDGIVITITGTYPWSSTT